MQGRARGTWLGVGASCEVQGSNAAMWAGCPGTAAPEVPCTSGLAKNSPVTAAQRAGFHRLLQLFPKASHAFPTPGKLLPPHRASGHRIWEKERLREAAGLNSARDTEGFAQGEVYPLLSVPTHPAWTEPAQLELALVKLGSRCIYYEEQSGNEALFLLSAHQTQVTTACFKVPLIKGTAGTLLPTKN